MSVAEPAGSGNPGERFGVRFLWRFLLLTAALGLVGQLFATPLTRALLPLFRAEMEFLDATFRIESLVIDQDGADRVIRVEVSLAQAISANGRTFYPDPRGRARASTLVGNLWMPCVLLVAVALAWPTRSRRTVGRRGLAIPFALLLLATACVPPLLLAELWGIIWQAANAHPLSPLLIWSDFLLNGGVIALPLVVGAALGHLSNRRA